MLAIKEIIYEQIIKSNTVTDYIMNADLTEKKRKQITITHIINEKGGFYSNANQ